MVSTVSPESRNLTESAAHGLAVLQPVELAIGGYRLRVDCNGGTIAEPVGADPQRTEELRLGPLQGLRLHARGHLVLHGSCVGFGSHTVCIVGPSGSGKSTLAGMLCCRGASLVADGMTAVDPSTLLISPGPPRAKLNDTSLLLLGQDPSRFPLVHGASRKHYFPVQNSAAASARESAAQVHAVVPSSMNTRSDPPRLGLILLIEDAEQTAISPIVGARALIELIRNVYLAEHLPPEHSSILMRRAATIVERGIQVKALRRRKRPEGLVEIAEAVEREMATMREA